MHHEFNIEEERKKTKKQKAVEEILKSVNNANKNEPKCFFIDGPGGTGKTFTYARSCTKLELMEM